MKCICKISTLKALDLNEFSLPFQIQEPSNPERVVRFQMSDDSVDRHGEVVIQDGWDFSDFANNPVCMAMHDYSSWPLGKGIAVGTVNNASYIDMEFDPPEVDERADVVFRKVKHGTIRAGSVGFIPVESFAAGQNKELSTRYPAAKKIFTKQKLLEWTICPIGANQNALVTSVAKRFGVEPEHCLVGSDSLKSEAAVSVFLRMIENIKVMKG